jgi:hypothetical protein
VWYDGDVRALVGRERELGELTAILARVVAGERA